MRGDFALKLPDEAGKVTQQGRQVGEVDQGES